MKTTARHKLQVRTKTWIENDRKDLLFGKGKTEILELIESQGSISSAAKNIGMSYKKAWSHIKLLQENIPDTLVIKRKGGGGKGGSELTAEAKRLIENYRRLQYEIEEFANRRFSELFLDDRE
jgi:molybdate transport system regulatory protein